MKIDLTWPSPNKGHTFFHLRTKKGFHLSLGLISVSWHNNCQLPYEY